MAAKENTLTQARLKKLLRYNPKTGEFFWRGPAHRRVYPGMRAGHKRPDGYWSIHIDKRNYYGHVLAWLYVHGRFPTKQLDHVNRNISSCKITDLREATIRQNRGNSKVRKDNVSGFKGVTWRGWVARINAPNGKRIQLGSFDTAEAAYAAYCKAAKEMFGEFWRGK